MSQKIMHFRGWNEFDYICRIGRGSLWSLFAVSHKDMHDWFLHFRSQWPQPLSFRLNLLLQFLMSMVMSQLNLKFLQLYDFSKLRQPDGWWIDRVNALHSQVLGSGRIIILSTFSTMWHYQLLHNLQIGHIKLLQHTVTATRTANIRIGSGCTLWY